MVCRNNFSQIELDKIVIRYAVEYHACNQEGCYSCLMGRRHGPYWYGSFLLAGEQKKIFLGKKFKPLDIKAVIRKDLLKQKKAEEKAQKNNWVERIDTKKLRRRKAQKVTVLSPLPTFKDFERDLRVLKTALPAGELKQIYRKLIKKYHPDQYPDHPQFTRWMAEINGHYTRKLRQAI
ncbi:MAG: hypothetical protein COB67_03735 [SAR324 cluster bacterium]|uniref:J domain-containing protein n=1 Tax=SAR324 cluster bacterium TaxID=2024889 RepID=A0A2A4T9C5_9DELT|nr:MAG: hypothetical protein COB67_03735 [SAR324 cluster bacterium]